MRKLKLRLLAWRNRTTIRGQLSLLVGIVVGFLITLLIFYSYFSQASANRTQQRESMERILSMESEQVHSYLDDLASYSLQLRNDSTFMTILQKKAPLSYTESNTIESLLRSLFYARKDIRRINLWLTRRSAAYYIESDRRRVMPLEEIAPESLPTYSTFSSGPAYISLRPVDDGLLEVTRTIIDSPFTDQLAIVQVIIDQTRVTELEKGHAQSQERFYLFDTFGISLGTLPDADAVCQACTQGENAIRLGGETCSLVTQTVDSWNFTVAVLKPYSVINGQLDRILSTTLVLGIISLLTTIFVVLALIRTLTAPLSALENRLHEVGAGDFSQKENIPGSSEVISLSTEINHMAASIQDLIDRSYLAAIGERSAQLAALEAQTNPHFLYNTLQAIGAESLAGGNPKVYRMITSLALLLRYSIQGGNLVPLGQELDYTQKYLMLQQARYGTRLQYNIDAEDSLLPASIPKLGILSLVENSIVHGMKNTAETVTIQISSRREDDRIILQVRDDGSGISLDELKHIREQLADPSVVLTQNIGLINLNSRVHLLYHDAASILVESRQTDPRETSVTILLPFSGDANEKSSDH